MLIYMLNNHICPAQENTELQPPYTQTRYMEDFDQYGYGYLLAELDEPPQDWMDPLAASEELRLDPHPFIS
jgi:hypothetical protein